VKDQKPPVLLKLWHKVCCNWRMDGHIVFKVCSNSVVMKWHSPRTYKFKRSRSMLQDLHPTPGNPLLLR